MKIPLSSGLHVLAVRGILFLVAGLGVLHAQLSATYEEPDLTTPVFEVGRLSLGPAVRSQLATVLAAGVTDYDAILDAKIIGLALRLDPGNRPARQAAERRKRGELPDAKQGNPVYPVPTVVNYLAGQSAGLRARGGVDNLALAGYLSSLAADIDPHNAVAKYEKETCAKLVPAPAWAFLKHQPGPTAAALPLLKRQSKIRGLSVSELPNGERTGAVMEMIVTAEEAHSRQEVNITTSRPVGESMRIALEEAGRAVKLRHPSFGAGQHLVLSFGDNYTPKDGPSGGAAFTLLLYSLYDPLQLAADCAMTGDITVDGRIRAVGGVPSKIHAALNAGCRVVAIPKENAEAVADVPLLYPANTLWKLQIFTVDTLDEALAVMREDRPADLRKAMELFTAVQQKVGLETPRLSAAQAAVVPQLREILRLAPGHASAAAMLKSLEGKAVGVLSLYASWEEVDRITKATLTGAAPTEGQRGINLGVVADGVNRLDGLRSRLDFRVADLCAADLAGLRALQQLGAAGPTPELSVMYRQRVQAILEVERRMGGDPSLIEALKH